MSRNTGSPILLVDDSLTKRHALREVLESAGFQVDEAIDGHQALDRARAAPRVILLDVQLPDMGGLEVCRRLRADPETAQIPVILISAAFVDGRDRLRGFEFGADDYIVLPISDEELLAKVTAWARVRNAEAELRHKNSELERQLSITQTITNTAADGLFMLDSTGRTTFANPSAEAMFGFKLDELQGKLLHDIIHYKRPDGSCYGLSECLLGQIYSHGRTVHDHEDVFFRKDGTPVHVSCSNAPLIENGRVVAAVLVMRDITARKQAEEELSAIYANAPVLMLLVDSERRVRKANKFAEQFIGASSPAGLIGQYDGEALRCLYALDDPSGCGFGTRCEQCTLRFTVLDTLAHGRSHHMVEVALPLNLEGRVQDITFLLSTASLKVQEEAQVLVTLQDITARKQAEQALIRTEKLAATGRLAATIAHEINNPLEAMTNIVYLLSRATTDATARGYVDLMGKQLQTVSYITNQTLKFHRENGLPSEFKLSELIGELLEFFGPKAKGQGVTVAKRLDTEGTIVGFSNEIRQVISNLLLNAIEATPRNGRVTIHLRESADWRNPDRRGYRISIADTGGGIDPRYRSRIFEPFFTTKGDTGTGLGLWVSTGIVDRASGFMRVRSTQRPGRSGTCFSVFLPAKVPLAEASGRRRYEGG